MTTLRKLLFLLLFPLLSFAQSPTVYRVDFAIYQGNASDSPAYPLLPADTLQPIVATYSYSRVGGSLVPYQPTVVRSGLSMKLHFANTVNAPSVGFYQITIGGPTKTRWYGTITASKNGVTVTPIPALILNGLQSDIAVLKAQYQSLDASSLTITAYNSYTAAVASTLSGLSSANAALTSQVNTKLAIADSSVFVRKATGLSLSQNSYTTTEKNKLAGIATGATNVTNNNQIANGAGYATGAEVTSTAAGLQTQITANGTAITTQTGRVNSLSTSVGTNTAGITTLKSNLATTQYNIQGTWNPSTNSPTLASSTTLSAGSAYVVSTTVTAGVSSTVLSGSAVVYSNGDLIVATAQGTWLRLAQALAIADGTVTPTKASFFVPGKNLFNPAAATDGFFINEAGGIFASGTYSYSDYIAVTPGLTYTGWDGTGNMRFTTFYNAAKAFVAGGSSTAVTSFTVPAGVSFVRVTLTTSRKATFQFEQSATATVYDLFYQALTPATVRVIPADASVTGAKIVDNSVTGAKLLDGSVTPLKTSFIGPGKNLFDINATGNEIGRYIDANGSYFSSASFNLTGFIPVTGSTSYYPTVNNRVVFYDASKVYISGVDATRGVNVFTTPSNAAFARLSMPVASWALFQLEAGTTGTTYEAYYLKTSGVQSTPTDGSVTSTKLATAAVTSDKTDFLLVGKNKFNKLTTTDGQYIDQAGAILTNAIYLYSDYMPVTSGLTYTGIGNGVGMRFTTYYNSVKGVVAGGSSTSVSSFTVPAGVSFVRVSILLTQKDAFQFEQSATATTYDPYSLIAQTPAGVPISPGYISPATVQAALAVADDPIGVTIAPTLYIPTGKEIALYVENIHKYFDAYKNKTDLIIAGGTQTGRAAKYTPVSTGTVAGTITAGNKSFVTILTKTFSVSVSNAALTTAKKVMNIGDSYTLRSTFVNSLVAGAGTGITFLGTRTTTASSGSVLSEGRGGWAVSTYVTLSKTLYSPFVQPLAGAYLYLGNTSFWINARAGLTDVVGQGYDYNHFVTASQFNATTGYPNSPRTNDVIYDNGTSLFKYWDGSAWQTISEDTLNFGVSFAKYRQAWGIAAPDIVHILLGTNDFGGATEATFAAAYTSYKTGYDALITSILADTPGAKIIVGMPVSSGRQGEFGTLSSERRKRAFWLLADKLTTDYGNRTGEGIYLNDYHSGVDRVYGYGISGQKPFENYTGTQTEDYKTDTVHLGADGFSQMADRYYGIIQSFR